MMRLPEYELRKIEEALRNNPHIVRCREKAAKVYNFHARYLSTKW
jgi:hypothetical protein